MTSDMLFKILGDRWLRLIVTLLLLAALAYQISLVIWQWVPAPELTTTQRDQAVSSVASVDSGAQFQQQAAAIGRAFLFGKAAARAVAVNIEEVVETRLNYKLRGIYYSRDESLSSAIVEIKPNQTNHYLLDDELAENITLAKIEPDHILLSRYGKLERLNLQKREPPGGKAFRSRTSGGVNASQTALLTSYKRRYSSNPMALATRFQAIPVQQDGQNIGFKLKALRGESLLKKLNFEANDIFTAVNGVALKNPFEALDALKSLTTASDISVTFMRNGAEQTLDFQI